MKRRNTQRGMTMIEMIIYMCISGIVIGMVILYFGDMLTSTDVQASQKNILTLRIQIAEAYQAEPDYSALSTENAVNLSLIPSSMLKGSDVHNAFGGDVTIEPNSDPRYFDISIDGVPGDACSKMALLSRGEWEAVTVNGTDVSQLASETVTSTVASACTEDTNTIVYTAK